MKRLALLLIGIVIISASVAFGFTYNRQSNAAAADVTDAVQVDLLGDRATPNAIFVEKGKYIQFNTKDGKAHNIGQGSGVESAHGHADAAEHEHEVAAAVSGEFSNDEAYKVQMKQTGTFTFHDHLNPKISVVVVVYEKDVK